jgi:hypothetical protein
MLLCEGIEDGLSLRASGRPESVFALPGISRLRHFAARRGQVITFARDGDEPDSTADKALVEGIDHLLLQKAEARVTVTPLGKDANDILREDGADAPNALVDAAVSAELSEAGEIKRLAGLKETDPAEYDRERVRIADKFGMRRPTLDKKVAQEKTAPKGGKGEADSNGLVEREPQPWHDQVSLAEVLKELRERLAKHIVFGSKAQGTAVTLWIAHTYVFEQFEFTPRLALESATARCGKTTLHDLLGLTGHRPVEADKLTPASLVRLKAATGPATVLLDEMGDALRASPELESVLRSGFQRGKNALVLRSLPDGSFVHEMYDVFAPVAIALVGSLRGALADRAIHIHLRRKSVQAKVQKLRHGRNRQHLLDIGRQLARWAADDGDALGDEPNIPEALNDRAGDFAVPLLAIADQAGGAWPEEARAALVQLIAEGADRASDNAILLLRDLRWIFDADLKQQEAGRPALPPEEQEKQRSLLAEKQEISSELLVEQLVRLAECPWPRMESGRPLSQYTLSVLLRDFSIQPVNMGPENARKRGYRRLQFTEAWSAYLRVFSPRPPNQGSQGSQPGNTQADFNTLRSDFENSQGSQPVPAVNPERSACSANSAGLALAVNPVNLD